MKWFLPFLFVFISPWAQAAQNEAPVLAPDKKADNKDKKAMMVENGSSREYSVTDDGNWHFALGGGLALGTTAVFIDGTSSANSNKYDTTVNFGPAVEIAAEARWMREYSFGFIGGLQLSSEYKADKFEVKNTTTGVTTKGDSDSKIQLTTIYGNAVYRWHWIYLPFGLNITSVKFTPGSASSGVSIDSKGGLGTQVGVGFLVHPNVALETHMFMNRWELETNSSGVKTKDEGSLFSFKFQAKYQF